MPTQCWSPAVALPAEQAGEHPTGGDQSAQPGQSGLGPGRALVLGAYKLDTQLLLALEVARAVDVGVSG